jgi:hypothetical protein
LNTYFPEAVVGRTLGKICVFLVKSAIILVAIVPFLLAGKVRGKLYEVR